MTTISSGSIIADSVCHGTWTVDGIAMNGPAWATLNNFVLSQNAEPRGGNLAIPGRHGSIPYRSFRAETKHTMEMLVVGDVDRFGDPTDDRSEGLFDNLQYLEHNVFALVESASGTRAAVLTLPGGKVRSGDVQIGNAVYGTPGISGAMQLTFDVIIPAGQLSAPA